MTVRTDRRSVLTGFGALGAASCVRAQPARPEHAPVAPEALDLAVLERENGGRLGFVAHDLASGRQLAWRGGERFVYCSTFKTFLAAATFLRVQTGEERLDRQVPVNAEDLLDHAPVTEPAVGASLSVEALMKGAVEVSDNPAANLLLGAMGGLAPMRDFYRFLGDDSTTVDRFEPDLNRPDGDKDTITPHSAASNLKRLLTDPDTPLSVDHKALLLRWMTDSPTGRNRLRAGVPVGWIVAHKTGTDRYGPTNDIGILYPPTGAPVIAAAYYHANPDAPSARNEAVIASATRMALWTLGRA